MANIAKTLVVAPHPDDETLGVGGTLLRRKAEGVKVAWLIVTGISERTGWAKEKVKQREAEIARVSELIGFDEVYNLSLPTIQLDDIPMKDLVAQCSAVFNEFNPEEIFLPHRADVHSDHQIVCDMVAACVKWFRYPSVQRVLAYETLSETEFGLDADCFFRPNYFVDISNFLERKLEVMAIYQSELSDFPFPRSDQAIRALASLRGTASGFMAAEAFQLLRERQ